MADLLLRRARVGHAVVDLRIEAGRVAAIGPDLGGPAETVDLDGRVLLRGCWDEHVHVVQAALAAQRIPLTGSASASEVLQRVRVAAEADAAAPLIGTGFQDGLWPDRPSLAALDAIVGDRTAVLLSHDVHTAWIGSATAQRLGLRPGEDGLVREALAFAAGLEANRVAERGVEPAVAALMAAASRRGVVGVVDFEMAWSRDAWRGRMAGAWTGPRVEAAVYPADLVRAATEGGRSGEPVPGTGGLLAVGPLKALADGALNTRTAWCSHDYPEGGSGLPAMTDAELRGLLERARAAGLVPAIHAIGDAAVGAVLDAFAAVAIGGRIEHAQLVAEEDVARFGALGVTASVQPAHLLDDREVAARHWPGRTGRAYPLRALLAAGATLAFGSDAPVAPLDPWLAIRAAVDRALPGEDAWHPEQRIPLADAVAASTRGRAVPRVGDVADLIVLDGSLEEQRGDVAATLVGGRFTHRAL